MHSKVVGFSQNKGLTVVLDRFIGAAGVVQHFAQKHRDFHQRLDVSSLRHGSERFRVVKQSQFGLFHLGVVPAEHGLCSGVQDRVAQVGRPLVGRHGVLTGSVNFTEVDQ